MTPGVDDNGTDPDDEAARQRLRRLLKAMRMTRIGFCRAVEAATGLPIHPDRLYRQLRGRGGATPVDPFILFSLVLLHRHQRLKESAQAALEEAFAAPLRPSGAAVSASGRRLAEMFNEILPFIEDGPQADRVLRQLHVIRDEVAAPAHGKGSKR